MCFAYRCAFIPLISASVNSLLDEKNSATMRESTRGKLLLCAFVKLSSVIVYLHLHTVQ